MLDNGGERGLAVVGLHHVMAGTCQQIAQNLAIVFLIFDHKNARHVSPTCWC